MWLQFNDLFVLQLWLQKVFSDLGYDLHVKNDLTAEQIRGLVKKVAKSDSKLSQWGKSHCAVSNEGEKRRKKNLFLVFSDLAKTSTARRSKH